MIRSDCAFNFHFPGCRPGEAERFSVLFNFPLLWLACSHSLPTWVSFSYGSVWLLWIVRIFDSSPLPLSRPDHRLYLEIENGRKRWLESSSSLLLCFVFSIIASKLCKGELNQECNWSLWSLCSCSSWRCAPKPGLPLFCLFLFFY